MLTFKGKHDGNVYDHVAATSIKKATCTGAFKSECPFLSPCWAPPAWWQAGQGQGKGLAAKGWRQASAAGEGGAPPPAASARSSTLPFPPAVLSPPAQPR